jgi:hypothetical protein
MSELSVQFFRDCAADGREPNRENLNAWLWFTCPAPLREQTALEITTDHRFHDGLRVVRCLRCGHEWATRLGHPTRCANPKCKSPYWDKARKEHRNDSDPR